MSFSFRNIFSSDDSDFEVPADSSVPNGFTPSDEVSVTRGNLTSDSPKVMPSQSFLVSELLPYIPKAIAALSGIPMSKELQVPLPADGTLDVRLSTLYQLCPELFAAEITPLNDSVVTLPPRLGATPLAAEASSSLSQSSAFSKPLPTATGHVSESGPGNPFWSPVTPAAAKPEPTTAVPSTSPTVSWPAAPPTASNPFSSEPTPPKNAFAAPDPAPAPAEPKAAGGFDAPTGSPAGSPKTENAFGAGAAPGFSGFGNEPSTGFFGFGESVPVKKDSAEPETRYRANPFENDQAFATLFSKQTEADADIPFPEKSEGDAAPPTGEPEGIWGAMFSGTAFGEEEEESAPDAPFAGAPFESIGNLLKQAAATEARIEGREIPAAPIEKPAPVFEGFGAPSAPASFSAPPSLPSTSGPDSASAFAAGFSAFAPASAEAGPPPASTKEAPVAEKAPEISWAFDAAFAPAPATAPAPEIEETMNPVPTAFETPAVFTPSVAEVAPAISDDFGAAFNEVVAPIEPAPAPVTAPVEEVVVSVPSEPTPAPVNLVVAPVATAAPAVSPDLDDDLRDLELRAIFSTSESFTLSKVARNVVALAGINSCSLSTPAKLVQAARREENRLGNEAREMVATLRSLAKLTGLPEAKTFTLQTDRGIVSLFLEGECCVTVHHDTATFQPGVREKLILIARNIAKLRE